MTSKKRTKAVQTRLASIRLYTTIKTGVWLGTILAIVAAGLI